MDLKAEDKCLIILALRAKFMSLEPSIADYHRWFKRIFNHSLCYNAVRNRLRKLEQHGLLRSELVKGVARNDLVDSKGEVKLSRHTRVYKKVYAINVKSKVLKRLINALESFSRKLFKKGLSKVFSDDETLKSLARW